MQIANIIFLLPLAVGLVAANNGPKRLRNLMENKASTIRRAQSDAFKVGRNSARDKWNAEGYPCTGIDGIIENFWRDVQDSVFEDCETLYRWMPSKIKDCKSGAKKFVYKKLNDCVVTSDCRDLGERAAKIVTSLFCAPTYSGDPFLPPNCVRVAKSRCKDRVIDLVQGKADAGDCRGVTSAMNHVFELEDMCEDKVDDMTNAAHLP